MITVTAPICLCLYLRCYFVVYFVVVRVPFRESVFLSLVSSCNVVFAVLSS